MNLGEFYKSAKIKLQQVTAVNGSIIYTANVSDCLGTILRLNENH